MSVHYSAVLRCDNCGHERTVGASDVYSSRTPGATVVIFEDDHAGTTWPLLCTACRDAQRVPAPPPDPPVELPLDELEVRA